MLHMPQYHEATKSLNGYDDRENHILLLLTKRKSVINYHVPISQENDIKKILLFRQQLKLPQSIVAWRLACWMSS